MKIYQILSNSERIHNSVGYSSVEICDNSLSKSKSTHNHWTRRWITIYSPQIYMYNPAEAVFASLSIKGFNDSSILGTKFDLKGPLLP